MSYCLPFEYKVIYSRRRSLSVKISDDNSLTVRCPVGTSESKIESFLRDKSRWIQMHMASNAAAMSAFADVIAYKKVLIGGVAYDLKIADRNYISKDTVCITGTVALKRLLIKSCGDRFSERFKAFAEKNGFVYSSLSFRSYKGRWGCCDSKNNITFNYKLLMLPQDLQDCVIAHELCHTRVHDHSARFHALLDAVFPSNRTAEKRLKGYSFIARMY